MNKYGARQGSRISDDDANIIGLEQERIAISVNNGNSNRHGTLAEEFLEAASDPLSPVHKFFEWDDTKAGKQWRLQQVRVLLGSIVPIFHSGEKVNVRALNAVPILTAVEGAERATEINRRREYVAIQEMSTNNALKTRLAEQFIRDLQNVTGKYEQYRAVWPDFDAHFKSIFTKIEAMKPMPAILEEVLV